MCFPIFLILENKNYFSKTVTKQTLNLLKFSSKQKSENNFLKYYQQRME